MKKTLLLLTTLLCACIESYYENDPHIASTVEHKTIFVTSNMMYGNQVSDLHCEALALQQGLQGTYVGWFSTMGAGPINAIDKIKSDGPWFDVKGHEIFQNKSQLRLYPLLWIQIDEQGHEVGPTEISWTGTRLGGTLASEFFCQNFVFIPWGSKDPSQFGMVGLVGSKDQRWTEAPVVPCTQQAHMICLEQ